MREHRTNIKKNDLVKVIAGKDRGKTGKVLRVIPEKRRVLVEKVNVVKRHTRASQKMGKGGILERENPLHISNVMIVCPKCNAAVRTGKRVLEDGSRVRYCRRCSEVLDT